jgi:hypothetical protein
MDALSGVDRRVSRLGDTMTHRRRSLAARAFLATLWLCHAVGAGAQSTPTVEDVEAAYLQKFVGYIDWPARSFASPTSPVVIGVVGSERMLELLSATVGARPAQSRQIEVRRLSKPQDAAGAQLVFVGQAAWPDLHAWSEAARGNAVVIATDAPHGIDDGASLAFVQIGTRVRFEASLPAAQQAGVKISARMLAVAERVVGSPP